MAPKRCCTCRETKPVTDFQKSRSMVDGLQRRCRVCQAAASARWWRQRGAIDGTLQQRQSERRRRHYENNRETEKAAARDRSAHEYAVNRTAVLKRQRTYYAAEPDKFKARSKAYRQANPAKSNEFSARRRARLRDAFVEAIDPTTVWERDIAVCGICGEWVSPPGTEAAEGRAFTLDHVMPLARGGTHEYRNVQAAHVSCNQRKQASAPPAGALAAIADREERVA